MYQRELMYQLRALQCNLCPQLLQLGVHVTCLYQVHLLLQLSVRTQIKEKLQVISHSGQKCFFSVSIYLYCSCVSRSSFFSSSILSVVSLRTITSSMVSTTSPFSPRLRLEKTRMRTPSYLLKQFTFYRSVCVCIVVLTLVLLWLPAAQSIVRHNAKKHRRFFFLKKIVIMKTTSFPYTTVDL